MRVETLPRYTTHLDMSVPSSLAYNLMEWLKETTPQFTAVHFLTPYLAHYACLARQQGLALLRTPLVAHFVCVVFPQPRAKKIYSAVRFRHLVRRSPTTEDLRRCELGVPPDSCHVAHPPGFCDGYLGLVRVA